MKRILTGVLLGCGAAASAHHSYAEFDMSKTVSISGTVAKVEWVNPHSFVWLYVPNKKGGHDLYSFENGSASMLRRYGWTRDTLSAGEKITVHYRPLKDGRKGGYFIKATHADGRVSAGDPYAPGGTKSVPALNGAPE